mgnify:CR=1 FL=1
MTGAVRETSHPPVAPFGKPVLIAVFVAIGLLIAANNVGAINFARWVDTHPLLLLAEGFVRVACVSVDTFQPMDLPHDVVQILSGLADLAHRQARGEVEFPWT